MPASNLTGRLPFPVQIEKVTQKSINTIAKDDLLRILKHACGDHLRLSLRPVCKLWSELITANIELVCCSIRSKEECKLIVDYFDEFKLFRHCYGITCPTVAELKESSLFTCIRKFELVIDVDTLDDQCVSAISLYRITDLVGLSSFERFWRGSMFVQSLLDVAKGGAGTRQLYVDVPLSAFEDSKFFDAVDATGLDLVKLGVRRKYEPNPSSFRYDEAATKACERVVDFIARTPSIVDLTIEREFFQFLAKEDGERLSFEIPDAFANITVLRGIDFDDTSYRKIVETMIPKFSGLREFQGYATPIVLPILCNALAALTNFERMDIQVTSNLALDINKDSYTHYWMNQVIYPEREFESTNLSIHFSSILDFEQMFEDFFAKIALNVSSLALDGSACSATALQALRTVCSNAGFPSLESLELKHLSSTIRANDATILRETIGTLNAQSCSKLKVLKLEPRLGLISASLLQVLPAQLKQLEMPVATSAAISDPAEFLVMLVNSECPVGTWSFSDVKLGGGSWMQLKATLEQCLRSMKQVQSFAVDVEPAWNVRCLVVRFRLNNNRNYRVKLVFQQDEVMTGRESEQVLLAPSVTPLQMAPARGVTPVFSTSVEFKTNK